MADSPRLTQTGILVGSVAYVSPEACNGERLDARTDIWAFGVMLYEMLTGELPFVGENLSGALTAILTQPVPDPALLCPDVPEALADLVYRMLEKDRKQRIPSVRLVGAELEAILRGWEAGSPARLAFAESRFATPTPPAGAHDLPAQTTLERIERGRMVGRDRELREATALWNRALSGTGQTLLVSGEPGIGKTRLVRELVSQVAVSGGRALVGASYAQGGAVRASGDGGCKGMSEVKALHGLACPNCGGTVPAPGGQAVVRCPYCDVLSLVRGDRGLQRRQVELRADRDRALSRLQSFLEQHQEIAPDAAQRALSEEAFLVHLPFWVVRARGLGWVFGKKIVYDDQLPRGKPREVKIAREVSWNGAACEVGEFGVEEIAPKDQLLEPFDAEASHRSGLVFEPVGSISEARAFAERALAARIRKAAGLQQVAQVFVRSVHWRTGLVYYPLWVLRYRYRGRGYQVVVDGHSADVLYGKAPGGTAYRAAALVGWMAAGAIVAVDGRALALFLVTKAPDEALGFIGVGMASIGVGFSLMRKGYRAFRHGEQFEYCANGERT